MRQEQPYTPWQQQRIDDAAELLPERQQIPFRRSVRNRLNERIGGFTDRDVGFTVITVLGCYGVSG
jgi:hypothetical protein